jgi:hypothetical protein
MTLLQPAVNLLNGAERAVLLSIRVLLGLQVRLEDGVQHHHQRGLRDPVTDCRDTQRPLLAVRLGDVHSPNCLCLVRLLPEGFRQFPEPPFLAVRLDVVERLAVHAGSALVGTAAGVGMCEHVLAMNLVVQQVEAIAGFALRFGMQRRLQLLDTARSFQVAQSPIPRRLLRWP